MNLSRVTTIILACIMQHCFALAEPIRAEEDKKNEGNHIGDNSNLSLHVVNSKLRGDSESNSISNAGHGTPNRVLSGEKLTIEPGRYKIKSIYGTSIYIDDDDVKLVKNIEGKEVFIRSMGGNKYAIHSHEGESYMYVSGKGSNRKITPQPHAHSYEMFYIISHGSRGGNNVVSFKSVKWGNYLKAKTAYRNYVYTSTNDGAYEKFTLTFKPSEIYTQYPEYTYRIASNYGNNQSLRIVKNRNLVEMTKKNGSMERIVLRPICTPECGLYALKSAESGERYVRMPMGYGNRVDLQTRVGSHEVFRIEERTYSSDDDGLEPGEFRYVVLRSNKFGSYLKAWKMIHDVNAGLETRKNEGNAERFWLYKE